MHTPPGTQREENLERQLLEQRVAPGEHDNIKVGRAARLHAHFPLVDTDTDRANSARGTQLAHGAIPAVHELLEAPGVLVTVADPADVVDVQNVYPLALQAAQTDLVGTHDRVIRVIKLALEGLGADKALSLSALLDAGPGRELATGLRRDNQHLARIELVERGAESLFTQPEAVVRRRIKVLK